MDTSLVPYAMPSGVKRLMPFQEYPFNGDGYAVAEVLRLRAKHGLTHAFETGTCYGSTTLFFAEHFEQVITCEIHRPTFEIAAERLKDSPRVLNFLENSPDGIRHYGGRYLGLYFLDAHWGNVCPLFDELNAIAEMNNRPVLMIHDWKVPGRPDLGYDHFPDGRPFELSAITDHLDAIYGEGGWDHHYNDKAEGAKRGILYVEPKV